MLIPTLRSQDPNFQRLLAKVLRRGGPESKEVEEKVKVILQRVRNEGDKAVVAFSQEFDHRKNTEVASLELPKEAFVSAKKELSAEQIGALEYAASRIKEFHQRQLTASWSYTDSAGNQLGQRINPVARAGIYVPGGKAAYPSSVLMNAIPAKVAGVEEIIMTAPAPNGELAPMVLAAAAIAGVNRLFTIGGAQAIGALAFGTETVPAVDVIVGPGNQYVAAAKRQVFGTVGIDMVAGPSEVVILCDGQTNPEWVVMDLFAQAEHDENASAVLISPDRDFLARVESIIRDKLPGMERSEIIAAALRENSALIEVADLDQGMEIVNRIAPEHLELSVENPEPWLDKVRNAGAVFVGKYSAEVLGDYCAGPNHVLPTSGTARFSSPLGVYHFQKRTSVIRCSKESAREMGVMAAILARGEGLQAHALSAELRWLDAK